MADPRPGVTVLCGFLGAGKTTLLRHVLAQAQGHPWAAVVNDVAALNVDAAVVRLDSVAGDVVELGNGCVCCSSRDDLAEAIARLAAANRYEHLLIETTGVAEPRGVANLFVQRSPFGRCLGDVARLANLVTVLDIAAFAGALRDRGAAPIAPAGSPRPLVELMLEQVECADAVVLNQADRATADERAWVRETVQGLNPRADVIETEQGQVPSEWLVDRSRFDAAATLGAAAWIHALNAVVRVPAARNGLNVRPPETPAVPVHESRYAIRSFVYQARRPFAKEAFRALVTSAVPGLVRAKGFFWEREAPDEMGFLSIAGGVPRFDVLNPWWATMVEAGRVSRDEVPPMIDALWHEPYGDRRQELVFIGVGLDEAHLRRKLDACLAE